MSAPKLWDELLDLIGEDATRLLCERLGGAPVYVPQFPSSSNPLVLAIGHRATARLCNRYAGNYLWIPSRSILHAARRRDEIAYDLRRGLSPADIARRHGISVRRVYQLRHEV